jgi:hypothetical protein
MKIFTKPCTCDVCGGPGLARSDHSWANWLGGLRHTDLAVCAAYLKDQRNRLEQRERNVREAEERLAVSSQASPPPDPGPRT